MLETEKVRRAYGEVKAEREEKRKRKEILKATRDIRKREKLKKKQIRERIRNSPLPVINTKDNFKAFWEPINPLLLCDVCHSIKHANEFYDDNVCIACNYTKED